MNKTLNMTAFLLFFLIGISIQSSATDSLKISIDWNHDINRSHKYKKVFIEKDSEYIAWLYLTGKKIEVLDPMSTSKTRAKNSKGGNAPLLFTIEENGNVRYEKVRNAVHPSNRKKVGIGGKAFDIVTPKIIGSLPKGTMTYTSDEGRKIKVGIDFEGKARKVKIEILDLDENVIHILEDQTLKRGEYEYTWNSKNHPNGEYLLRYTMDGQCMTQHIEVGSNRSNKRFKKFWDWLF